MKTKREGFVLRGNVIEFKERLEEDDEFKAIFSIASNLDEVLDLAKENGYDLELEDIENDINLSDYLLEEVAGGEDDTYTYKLVGNNNFEFTSNEKEASKQAEAMVKELHKKGIYGKH